MLPFPKKPHYGLIFGPLKLLSAVVTLCKKSNEFDASICYKTKKKIILGLRSKTPVQNLSQKKKNHLSLPKIRLSQF